jgi:hypothetical protein
VKNDEMKNTTSNMMDVLQNSDNPKWRNCKMLRFLKKLNNGAYKVEDDKLIKDSGKIAEFKAEEKVRMEKESMRVQEEEKSNE